MNKKNSLYFFVIISLGFLAFFSYIHFKHLKASFNKTPVLNTLSLIPEKDRILIDQFFHHIIISECFAYTLFGDKPISTSYCLKTKDALTQRTATPHPFILQQWKTWEKYKHLFPSKTFALRKIASPKPDEAWIILINKRNFRKAIKKHSRLFRSILGPKTTGQQLLNTFLSDPYPFKKAIKERSILKGILFGYGKNNATLYLRKQTIEKALLSDNTTYLKPTHPYKTLQEELQDLTHTLCLFNSTDNTLIRFPRFLADHSTQETQDLIKKYNKQREQFLPLLTEENFLERIITRYTSP